MGFIDIRFFDILDIFLVAFLLYEFYQLIRGTVAINIFIGIFLTYLIWMLVRAFDMHLISSILGQVMGLGVIALVIVFQQEIRRFLLIMGTQYFSNPQFTFGKFLTFFSEPNEKEFKQIAPILSACKHMSETRTGALIVISNRSRLPNFAETGEILNADVTNRLIETIFFKNSPLHDGGVIVNNNKIIAAGCILPVSANKRLPKHLGLRHRAALGTSENTDAVIIVVSEETGYISVAKLGKLRMKLSIEELNNFLKEEVVQENAKNISIKNNLKAVGVEQKK